MITAKEACKKVMQSLVNLSDIESKINKVIENKKFEITLKFQGENLSKIYIILYNHFSPLGYFVSKYYSQYDSRDSIRIKISWDL